MSPKTVSKHLKYLCIMAVLLLGCSPKGDYDVPHEFRAAIKVSGYVNLDTVLVTGYIDDDVFCIVTDDGAICFNGELLICRRMGALELWDRVSYDTFFLSTNCDCRYERINYEQEN